MLGSNIFYSESTDENSLSSEQLEKILIDDKSSMVVKKGESIKLKEGYELILKGVNSDGQIYLELPRMDQLWIVKSYPHPRHGRDRNG